MISERLQKYAETHFAAREGALAPVLGKIREGLADCGAKEAVLMKYFYGTMPLRDAAEYDFAVFLSYVRHALWLREQLAWCRALPEALFVHHVLYYRINSEDITDCRPFFFEQLKNRVEGLSAKQAVLETNWWCAEHATYQSTDGRTASPMTMYRCGEGRCGEESTFLVTALRSIGIAARQVYTPRWAHCDDNHAWVEAYVDGEWHFLGACEPEEEWDRGWFTGSAGRALLIHSRIFGDYAAEEGGEVIGKKGILTFYNHTAAYTRTRKLCVRVEDAQGQAAQGAAVTVGILNMAEYYPAAVLTTDENGETFITLGLGDIKLHAEKDGMFAERTVRAAEDAVTLELTDTAAAGQTAKTEGCAAAGRAAYTVPAWVSDTWEEELFYAPEEFVVREGRITPEQEERGAARLAETNRQREERFTGILREALAEHTESPQLASAAYSEEEEALQTAGENAAEILAFLDRDGNPDRKKLLHALALKDYKDLKASVLEDHLTAQRGDWPEEVHKKALLCPRIWLEELRPYRSFIRAYFSKEQQRAFAEEPERIRIWIRANISYDAAQNYETVCASPVGCLMLRQGSQLSQAILFAAICRSLNIPARLEPGTLQPQYWQDGAFRTVRPEADGAILHLIRDPGSKWDYFQSWTLARLEGTRVVTMDYSGLTFEAEGLELKLAAGIYRLIRAHRLPDGSQRTAYRIFALADGQTKEIALKGWEQEPQAAQESCPLGDIRLRGGDGQMHVLAELTAEKGCILAFLGVGAEPTEHVLNELLEGAAVWNETDCRLLAVIKGQKDLENRTLRRVLDGLKGITLLTAEPDACAETARRMGVDAARLPVTAAVQKGGSGIYACSGYNVGSVELMRKLL